MRTVLILEAVAGRLMRLVTDTNGARKVQRTGRTPLWRWASTKTFLFGRNYGAWLMPRARTSTTLRECGRYARTPRARERESARGGQRAGEGPDAGARHDERRPARRQADVSEEGDAEARAGGSECRASERESGTGTRKAPGQSTRCRRGRPRRGAGWRSAASGRLSGVSA